MSECRARKCGRPCNEFLCAECAQALADALERVPWLLDELAVTELRQDRVSRGLRSGSAPRSPLLFDPRASDLRRALVTSITGWTRHLCEIRGVEYIAAGYVSRKFVGPLRWPDRRMPVGYYETADRLAEWIGDHLLSVRLDEAAGEIHHEITTAVAAGLAMINARPRQIYRGPCPTIIGRTAAGKALECGQPLYADAVAEIAYSSSRDGDREQPAAFVTCPRCGILHDTSRLESRLLSRSDHIAFTVPELVRITRELGEPVLRDRIDQWIHRGKLHPAAWRHNGSVVQQRKSPTDKPLYRLGAVRKLRAAAGTRGKMA